MQLLSPLTRLQTLHLNHLDLELFPEVLLTLTALTCLELGRNRMTAINPGIASLTNLQVEGCWLTLANGGRDLFRSTSLGLYHCIHSPA